MSKELAENGRGVSLSITNRDRHHRMYVLDNR